MYQINSKSLSQHSTLYFINNKLEQKNKKMLFIYFENKNKPGSNSIKMIF